MMDIDILVHTFFSMGGYPTLSLVGDFLSMDAPDFGGAVREIEIQPYFRRKGVPEKSLKGPYGRFHAYVDGLPRYRFTRKKRHFLIEYESTAGEMEETSKSGADSVECFSTVYREAREHLAVLRTRLKRADDFDVEGFLDWVKAKERDLPSGDGELHALAAGIEAYRKAKYDALDDWEKLGLDWGDFHPDARTTLDDPFFWKDENDFAPNGNDTGADVLGLFRSWRRHNQQKSSRAFFDRLLKNWQVGPISDSADSYSVQTHDESAIGLAFAHLKLEACCPEWIRDRALEAIRRQKDLLEQERGNHERPDDKTRTLVLMENTLKDCPVPVGTATRYR